MPAGCKLAAIDPTRPQNDLAVAKSQNDAVNAFFVWSQSNISNTVAFT
jgi:hypothetical protein